MVKNIVSRNKMLNLFKIVCLYLVYKSMPKIDSLMLKKEDFPMKIILVLIPRNLNKFILELKL